MTAPRLFWFTVVSGNALLGITAAIWWRAGWGWALTFLVSGPLVMLGCFVVALVLFFLFGSHAPACAAGCGRLAPFQLRGTRYRRALCDTCAAGATPQPPRAAEARVSAPPIWRRALVAGLGLTHGAPPTRLAPGIRYEVTLILGEHHCSMLHSKRAPDDDPTEIFGHLVGQLLQLASAEGATLTMETADGGLVPLVRPDPNAVEGQQF